MKSCWSEARGREHASYEPEWTGDDNGVVVGDVSQFGPGRCSPSWLYDRWQRADGD